MSPQNFHNEPLLWVHLGLRIVPLGHRLGFIADNLTPYTLSPSPLGLLFYEMHFHQGNFYERADVKVALELVKA